MWPTPRANDAEKRGNFDLTNPRNGLAAAAKLWPTPTVAGNYNRKGTSVKSGDGLATAVKLWSTPQASDNRDRGNLSNPSIQRRIALGKQVNLSMAVKDQPSGGALNPTWVEWLMGWPLGWTDCAASATDRFRQWLLSHGRF
jgi:DNA (cytosine-5)-methyltransferase 1